MFVTLCQIEGESLDLAIKIDTQQSELLGRDLISEFNLHSEKANKSFQSAWSDWNLVTR